MTEIPQTGGENGYLLTVACSAYWSAKFECKRIRTLDHLFPAGGYRDMLISRDPHCGSRDVSGTVYLAGQFPACWHFAPQDFEQCRTLSYLFAVKMPPHWWHAMSTSSTPDARRSAALHFLEQNR